jgi:Cu+-exporting ATPase
MDLMMRSMSMPQWNWVLWALASVVQFWPGRRFYRNAYHSIKDLSPDMNALVVMGTTAAYGVSSLITFFPNWLGRHQQHVYFESSAVVICLVLLGKYLEARSKQSTRESLYGLAKLQPQDAQRIVDQQTQRVAISEISLGDRLAVYEGQAIPLDGVIETGSSFIQEGMVTGEPIPKEKTIGDRVIGGTINGNGQLTIRVTAIGKDTFLSRMMAMVIDAQAHKPPIQTTLRSCRVAHGHRDSPRMVVAELRIGIRKGSRPCRRGARCRLPLRAGTRFADEHDGRKRPGRRAWNSISFS